MYGCQQILANKDKDLINILTFLCEESHKLTNMGIYYARQLYFKAKKAIKKFDLINLYKTNNHYRVLHSQAAQQTLLSVAESFQSYYGLIKAYQAGKITDKPKIPNYRKKGGSAVVSYPKQALKLKDGLIRVPLGNTCKRWFGLDSFKISLPSNLDFKNIKELRILPRNKCFYFEFIYKKEIKTVELNKNNVLGIDPGLNNWLTCVSSLGTSFIIDGKQIKSMNRWYNKQVANIKENKPKGFWNNQLAAITEKRNRQVKDGINKAARIVINYCLKNNIGTVVFGWNKRSKDSINIGKKNNSERGNDPPSHGESQAPAHSAFVPIPTGRLKNRIAGLCEQYSIQFIETEESYTSKTSFLDGDYLPTYGEKADATEPSSHGGSHAHQAPKDWKPSGRRTKRGLYRTAKNWYVNADCNGAANIIRKVTTTLSILKTVSLERVTRGVLTRPHKFFLWSAKANVARGGFNPSSDICLESPRL
ncbi:MAG: RNA-guided endonuclease InsQ/TnpB family protein [Xenococcus sp. (in: cyanobacteria)]